MQPEAMAFQKKSPSTETLQGRHDLQSPPLGGAVSLLVRAERAIAPNGGNAGVALSRNTQSTRTVRAERATRVDSENLWRPQKSHGVHRRFRRLLRRWCCCAAVAERRQTARQSDARPLGDDLALFGPEAEQLLRLLAAPSRTRQNVKTSLQVSHVSRRSLLELNGHRGAHRGRGVLDCRPSGLL